MVPLAFRATDAPAGAVLRGVELYPRLPYSSGMGRRPALLLALAWACGGAETTEFPAGLEPLEASTAVPADTTGAQQLRGQRQALLGSWQASARRSPRSLDPRPRGWQNRRAARWSVTEDVEPSTAQLPVRNEVDDIVTVEFDVTWRHGAVEGTDTGPTTASRWKAWVQPSFRCSRVGRCAAGRPDVTELGSSSERRWCADRALVRDYYDSIVAVTYG